MPTSFNGTYNGTLTASTVLKLTSPNRWNAIRVSNLGGATGTALGLGTDLIYVTTDDATTPAAGADAGWTVEPGQTIVVPNNQALWFQGFGGPGGNIDGVGLNNYTTYDPPQSATSTTAPNPGTNVWLYSTAAAEFTVEGVG